MVVIRPISLCCAFLTIVAFNLPSTEASLLRGLAIDCDYTFQNGLRCEFTPSMPPTTLEVVPPAPTPLTVGINGEYPEDQNNDVESTFPAWAIAASVVGPVVLLLLCGLCVWRAKRRELTTAEKDDPNNVTFIDVEQEEATADNGSNHTPKHSPERGLDRSLVAPNTNDIDAAFDTTAVPFPLPPANIEEEFDYVEDEEDNLRPITKTASIDYCCGIEQVLPDCAPQPNKQTT